MSRPVFEPSLTRADAAQAWASRQLFRRPAPQGSSISLFRAYHAFSDINVSGNGTTQDVFWDIWENCDTEVFEEQGAELDEITSVDLLVPGSVIITWGIKYANALDDSSVMALIDNEPVFGSNTYQTVHGRTTNGADSFDMGEQLMIQTFSRSYPTMDPFGSGDQFPVRFTFTVAQISGSANDIEFAFLDMRYEAADICEGPIGS